MKKVQARQEKARGIKPTTGICRVAVWMVLVTIFFVAHVVDQAFGDLGFFCTLYNRDKLSVAHTSLQEASIGEP